MEEIIAKQNKIHLALSSIMFFSILIKKDLEKGEIKDTDKRFISKYIQYGNVNLVLLIIVISSGALAYFLESDSIDILYKISLRTLTGLVIIENSMIIRNLLVKKVQL